MNFFFAELQDTATLTSHRKVTEVPAQASYPYQVFYTTLRRFDQTDDYLKKICRRKRFNFLPQTSMVRKALQFEVVGRCSVSKARSAVWMYHDEPGLLVLGRFFNSPMAL
jgi:hypothetical protein